MHSSCLVLFAGSAPISLQYICTSLLWFETLAQKEVWISLFLSSLEMTTRCSQQGLVFSCHSFCQVWVKQKAKPEDTSSIVIEGKKQQRGSVARPGVGKASGLPETLLTLLINRESIHIHSWLDEKPKSMELARIKQQRGVITSYENGKFLKEWKAE